MASSRRSEYEYQRRLHRVIDYIDRHLDEPLDLSTLAGVATFSSFHFHRLFHALTGEPLGDYIRRRRVELGAMRLLSQPDLTILEVALGVGFSSSEAFSRAFRARYGSTPSAWRKSKPDQVNRKSGQSLRGGRRETGGANTRKETAMKVKLIDREPVQVAYLRYSGPVGPSISSFWTEVVAPWLGANNLYGRERFGISLDDPTVTKTGTIRYDACVASPERETLTGNPQRKEIPGGKYAAMSFKGTGADIGAAWSTLLRDWLPKSGMQLDARPFFEYYPADGEYDPKTGSFTCDLCVPVQPL